MRNKLSICECCFKNKFIKMKEDQVLCSSCSLYHKKLNSQRLQLKYEVEKLRLKIYGMKNGRERLQ